MLHTPQGRAGWDPIAEMRRMQDEIRRVFAGVLKLELPKVEPVKARRIEVQSS